MSGDIPIPVRLACHPEHDAAVAPAVEPDDATQTRDNPHSLFGPPEQAPNVLAAMELRYWRDRGTGGAYFALDSVGAFNREMTNDMGFNSLGAVNLDRGHLLRATVAALLFGFATNLQNVRNIIGSPVPSESRLVVPCVMTLGAVAGLIGRSQPPAAVGKACIQ